MVEDIEIDFDPIGGSVFKNLTYNGENCSVRLTWGPGLLAFSKEDKQLLCSKAQELCQLAQASFERGKEIDRNLRGIDDNVDASAEDSRPLKTS